MNRTVTRAQIRIFLLSELRSRISRQTATHPLKTRTNYDTPTIFSDNNSTFSLSDLLHPQILHAIVARTDISPKNDINIALLTTINQNPVSEKLVRNTKDNNTQN